MSTPVAGALAVTPLYATPADAIVSWDDAGATWRSLGTIPVGGGTVTSIAAGAGITVSPSPIVGAGTVSLTVPVSVANGGTGTSAAFTAGSVVFAGASGVYTQDNANLFWDDGNNRLGIGVNSTTPGAKLHIEDASNGGFQFTEYSGATTNGPMLRLSTARGTQAAPSQTQADDLLGALRGGGYSNAGAFTSTTISGVNLLAAENFTASAQGTYLSFQATATGTLTPTEKMRIQGNGNVGIGTTAPRSPLEVNYTFTAPPALSTAPVSSGVVLGAGNIGLQINSWDATGAGGYSSAIQSRHLSTSTSPYALWLNPLGGPLVLGQIYPVYPRGTIDINVGATGPTALATAVPSGSALFGDVVANVGAQVGVWNIGGGAYPFFIQARHFSTANAPYNLTLQPLGGNVGIGTQSPGYKLDVGNGTGAVITRVNGGSSAAGDGPSLIFGFGGTAIGAIGGYSAILGGAANDTFTYYAPVKHWFPTAPTYNQTGAWTAISDARVKEDIVPYERGLAAITALEPVVFRYRAGSSMATKDAPSEPMLGLLADQVEPHVPEIVSEISTPDDRADGSFVKSLEPGNLIYAVINSIKELAARVAVLEKPL